MYAEPEFVRSGRLSRRYSVTVTVCGNRIDAEWTPAPPNKLTNQEMRRYRKIRDAAIAELSKTIGGGVAVVELAGGFGPDQQDA